MTDRLLAWPGRLRLAGFFCGRRGRTAVPLSADVVKASREEGLTGGGASLWAGTQRRRASATFRAGELPPTVDGSSGWPTHECPVRVIICRLHRRGRAACHLVSRPFRRVPTACSHRATSTDSAAAAHGRALLDNVGGLRARSATHHRYIVAMAFILPNLSRKTARPVYGNPRCRP